MLWAALDLTCFEMNQLF